MIAKLCKSTLLLIVSLTTISCLPLKRDVLKSVCESHPELCNDLHKLGTCNYKRTYLIRARYYDKIEPNQEHTRDLLNKLDDYESCLELALMVQLTRHQERKQNRVDNYLTTQRIIEDRLKQIKDTQDPHIAYYLWTHYQDLRAKAVFLNAASKAGVTDVKLLTKLAAMYAKEAPQYSLNLYYQALQKSHSIEELPINIFTLMMTLFYQNREFEYAYIWALLAKKEDHEDELSINLDIILQKGLINGEKLISNDAYLQQTAETYHKQLTNDTFNSQAPKLSK